MGEMMKPGQPDAAGREALLVDRARQGDEDSFSELVRMLSPRLHTAAFRVLRNWADAEDVVQVALWKAFRHLPEYRQQGAFSTWLTRITLNEGIALLRKRRVTPTDQANDVLPYREDVRFSTHGSTPEQIFASDELRGLVRQCIGCIGPNYRSVLWLWALDELSHEDIASRLHLTPPLVKIRLHRGRRMLAKSLARRGCLSRQVDLYRDPGQPRRPQEFAQLAKGEI